MLYDILNPHHRFYQAVFVLHAPKLRPSKKINR